MMILWTSSTMVSASGSYPAGSRFKSEGVHHTTQFSSAGKSVRLGRGDLHRPYRGSRLCRFDSDHWSLGRATARACVIRSKSPEVLRRYGADALRVATHLDVIRGTIHLGVLVVGGTTTRLVATVKALLKPLRKSCLGETRWLHTSGTFIFGREGCGFRPSVGDTSSTIESNRGPASPGQSF